MATIETRQCPDCPAWMVRRPTERILASFPPRTVMEWWCGCGHREPAGSDRTGTADLTEEWWHAVNRQRVHEEQVAATRARPWWKRLLTT